MSMGEWMCVYWYILYIYKVLRPIIDNTYLPRTDIKIWYLHVNTYHDESDKYKTYAINYSGGLCLHTHKQCVGRDCVWGFFLNHLFLKVHCTHTHTELERKTTPTFLYMILFWIRIVQFNLLQPNSGLASRRRMHVLCARLIVFYCIAWRQNQLRNWNVYRLYDICRQYHWIKFTITICVSYRQNDGWCVYLFLLLYI